MFVKHAIDRPIHWLSYHFVQSLLVKEVFDEYGETCQYDSMCTMQSSAAECQYNMILHTSLQELSRISIRGGTQKDTPLLALMAELWGVFCKYHGENWPRYNGIALYIVGLV